MDFNELESMLPHRPPILMLDRVLAVEPGQKGTGEKYFSPKDSYFVGHFPGKPLLPGVLILEAFAQTAMVILRAKDSGQAKLGYLAKVSDAGFYLPIEPNQTIQFQVEITRKLGQFFMASGIALRDGTRCAKASLTLAIGDG